jgi:hypothetical protein
MHLVHKLAYSFLDSIVQSDAPLLMSPQQQALCAVYHALKHYGMPNDVILSRYARKAAAGGSGVGQMKSVIDALEVGHAEYIACGSEECCLD